MGRLCLTKGPPATFRYLPIPSRYPPDTFRYLPATFPLPSRYPPFTLPIPRVNGPHVPGAVLGHLLPFPHVPPQVLYLFWAVFVSWGLSPLSHVRTFGSFCAFPPVSPQPLDLFWHILRFPPCPPSALGAVLARFCVPGCVQPKGSLKVA